MEKVDYKKTLKYLYGAKVGTPTIVTVPKMNFLMVDGKGDPNTSPDYGEAIEALYPVAYIIKFLCKDKYDQDFSVMPLEGLWWTENMADFSDKNKGNWLWTAMVMQPEVVTKAIFTEAMETIKQRKIPKALDKVRFDAYDEGLAAQVMYIGPYEKEGPTITALHKFIEEHNGILDETTKHHHEIYLSDPRRTDSSKLKTIIRQPF